MLWQQGWCCEGGLCWSLEVACSCGGVSSAKLHSGRCMLNAIFVILASDSSCRSKQAPIQVASCGTAQSAMTACHYLWLPG